MWKTAAVPVAVLFAVCYIGG